MRITNTSVRKLLSLSALRAINAAEVGFGERRPTAAECIGCAKVFGVAPVVILGRFGYLPSAMPRFKRSVYAYLERPTCRAAIPTDGDALCSLMLYQLGGGVVRCELVPSRPSR